MTMDARQSAPATLRNREPILQVLKTVLPTEGTVLEVASGTGEHGVFFAPHFPQLQWIPSDPNPDARASIAAWQKFQSGDNLHPPLALDVCERPWPLETEPFDTVDLAQFPVSAIVNINMIHISPWEACRELLAGANRLLPSGGILYLYGPYKENNQHTAPSNEAFDQSLQTRNPQWGIRNLEDVIELANTQNLQFVKKVSMPANNLSVIFQKK